MKKIIMILLLIILIFSFSGCDFHKYTESEHLEIIKKKVEKRYMTDETNYISYKLYKLYNEEEELNYVLVELEPEGYVIVRIYKQTIFYIFSRYIYTRYDGKLWFRYTWIDNPDNLEVTQYVVNLDGVGPYTSSFSKVKQYEYNEEGSLIVYKESPYKAANVLNEKLYLLKVKIESNTEYIMCVKRGDKFLNLVSMQEFELKEKYVHYELPCIEFGFIHGFDL